MYQECTATVNSECKLLQTEQILELKRGRKLIIKRASAPGNMLDRAGTVPKGQVNEMRCWNIGGREVPRSKVIRYLLLHSQVKRRLKFSHTQSKAHKCVAIRIWFIRYKAVFAVKSSVILITLMIT